LRNSLDEFARFVEKQSGREGAATADPGARSSDAGASPAERRRTPGEGVRYVLRNGVTHAVATKPDAPSHQEVADAIPAAAALVAAEPTASPSYAEQNDQAAALYHRLPRHLQLLVSIAREPEEEAAQKYYTRGFKESRRQLIERLLDPTLTLEDTARVLGVVPATVRRYTNRGVLPHHRTVGQQRRFRLSDVLSFLEGQQDRRGDDMPEFADD
jgi:excisionase family DNA binding protein